MNDKKQIEEMAFNLIMATSPLGVKDLTKQFDYKTVATDLYELYGWRKASDVAREIFEEIEKIIDKHHSECYEYEDGDECDTAITYISYISCDLDELKKKYTEGEG